MTRIPSLYQCLLWLVYSKSQLSNAGSTTRDINLPYITHDVQQRSTTYTVSRLVRYEVSFLYSSKPWKMPELDRRPYACKARTLPTELIPVMLAAEKQIVINYVKMSKKQYCRLYNIPTTHQLIIIKV